MAVGQVIVLAVCDWLLQVARIVEVSDECITAKGLGRFSVPNVPMVYVIVTQTHLWWYK
jgi:hypothetical protein